MARPGVTEQEVFEAIGALLEMGSKVTVESLRAELGHGSPNTINRHLRTWREKPPQIIHRDSSLQVKHLKKQVAEFEAQLEIKIAQTQHFSQEMVERDKKLLELEKALLESEQALKAARIENAQCLALHQAVIAERQQILDALVQIQRQQAEQFRKDIKAVNEMSLSKVRDISVKSQDRWLEEKVKVRELSLEIEALKLEIQELKQKVLAQRNCSPLFV
jgi:hypothetical protein